MTLYVVRRGSVLDRVTVENGLVFLEGKAIGIVVHHDVPGSKLMPTFGDGPVRVALAKDQEEFEQLAMYQWKANIAKRKFDIQKKYNQKQDNQGMEHYLKPLEDWMSIDE